MKLNSLVSARFEMDASEPTECADRCARNIRKFQIELHNFITSKLARVCDHYGCIERVASIDWRLRQTEIAVIKCRVAEAISKRPERLAVKVTISSAFHRVVLEVRQLVHIFVESDWQTSRRIVFAAQSFGDGRSAFFAGIPSFEDCICMRFLPVHAQRAAVRKHDN